MRKIINKIRCFREKFIHSHFPYFWAKHIYKIELGRKLDLSHPKDINEKILWLEFFTDTRQWALLSDKYAVREYVRQRVGDDVLVPLLGKWDNVEDIDFAQLPNKFVLKPNNGSYNVIIVEDKQHADIKNICEQLKHSINTKFGLDNAEPHYLRIKPCIIAEQMLDNPKELVDYKIWCFNGKPYSFFVCVGRNPITHHANFLIYNLDWEKQILCLSEEFRSNKECPKPENLKGLISVASKLSAGLPQCRVDLYCVNGHIYFGEMTMTSNYGMMPYFTQDTLEDMGNHCMLPKRTYKDYLYSLKTRYFPIF